MTSDNSKLIAEIYREMEIQLINSMTRNLQLHLADEADTGFSFPQWQAIKLKELKRFQRENKSIINRATKGLNKSVSEHLQKELQEGSKQEFKRYKKALKAGYKSAYNLKDSFFKVNDNKVKALANALENDLTNANHAALRMMNDTYRQTIFKAVMFAANGTMTEKQAYDKAVESFLSRGINCIEYKDGRRVNIADYCSMAVRTANQRAYMMGEGEFRKSIGETLVIISKHNTSCELCKPFENKVLIDDVYSVGKASDGDYMLLSEAMAQGLYHPRCRHGLGTYYPELEDINGYETADNKLNDYGKYQQAHIVNMIQRYKRLVIGSVAKENTEKYREKLNYFENKKAEFVGVDNISKNGIIISDKEEMVDNDLHYIGKIDKKIYECVTKDIQSDDVIITDKQIEHIVERHPNDYERYYEYIKKVVQEPDYILEANKPNTAFVLKHIAENEKNYEIILRLKTSNDPAEYKNSVITFFYVEEKRYKRYLRTKKILYKSE